MASNILQYNIISRVSSWHGYILVKMTAGEKLNGDSLLLYLSIKKGRFKKGPKLFNVQ